MNKNSPRLKGVRLTVADLDRAANFYTGLLDFEMHAETDHEIELSLGEMTLALRKADPRTMRAIPADSRSNDRWFRHIAIVVRDMEPAFARLRAHHEPLISRGPQTLPAWNAKSAGIEALYFLDPDRHPLELIHFPPDKGKAAWRESERELFLGVDHTAIVVADAQASLAFYRDEIGLTPVAEVINHGAEQEALSALPRACVRVTSLAGSGTCGFELLQYLAPLDGRRMPGDSSANDIWWAQTLIAFTNPGGEPRSISDPDGHQGEVT